MYQATFAYPILPGKTDLQRQHLQEKALNDLSAYHSAMRWTRENSWIQKLPKEDLFILSIQSDEPTTPEQLSSRFRKRYESECPIAKEVHSIYLETLGLDFCDPSSYPTLEPLPDFPIDFTEEELADKTIMDYAFAYPVLPEQAELLIKYNQDNYSDPDRLAYFKAMRKRLGLTEVAAWIQRGFDREMIVSHQKIIEPLSKANQGYYDAVAEEEMMRRHQDVYLKATGLNSKELIPDLEKL